MESTLPKTQPLWVNLVTVVIVLLIVVGLTFFYVFVLEPQLQKPPAPESEFRPPGESTPFVSPPVVRPPVKSAAEAELADDAPVIGVEVNGKARAYVVHAFDRPFHHVVNDLLGETPISLAYCNHTECMRVFTSDEPGEPLKLVLFGRYEGKLVLKAGDGIYHHADCKPIYASMPKFPYREHSFVRTTWKHWKAAHPETDAYLGVDLPSPRPEAIQP